MSADAGDWGGRWPGWAPAPWAMFSPRLQTDLCPDLTKNHCAVSGALPGGQKVHYDTEAPSVRNLPLARHFHPIRTPVSSRRPSEGVWAAPIGHRAAVRNTQGTASCQDRPAAQAQCDRPKTQGLLLRPKVCAAEGGTDRGCARAGSRARGRRDLAPATVRLFLPRP